MEWKVIDRDKEFNDVIIVDENGTLIISLERTLDNVGKLTRVATVHNQTKGK